MEGNKDASDSDNPLIDDNIIRIQLRKPNQHKWELRTRNLSPSIRFPTIQLFDCEGNLLVETNDENISIKSSDYDDGTLRSSQSLREKDFRHVINKNSLKKHNTISGGKIFTRIYRKPLTDDNANKNGERYIVKDSFYVANIPNKLMPSNNDPYLKVQSVDTSPLCSDLTSELSSLKSSNNELSDVSNYMQEDTPVNYVNDDKCVSISSSSSSSMTSLNDNEDAMQSEDDFEISAKSLTKSKSFHEKRTKYTGDCIQRSKSGVAYKQPCNKVSFINTSIKSLPKPAGSNLDSVTQKRETIGSTRPPLMNSRDSKKTDTKMPCRLCSDNSSEDISNVPTDVAADCELKKRLKIYRRGISEIEPYYKVPTGAKRRCSMSEIGTGQCSSSESLDEADLVLNRLRRRILRNKIRERNRGYKGARKRKSSPLATSGEGWQDAEEPEALVATTMGSNISQHSAKGLKGRRARSSGDLCNGDAKSQSEGSVCGSVVGDVMAWNRSLPNHLDGNRHLAEYSRVNHVSAEFGTYNRTHPKGGRGLRYRISKSGSDAEPVWKRQDPGCDQGYGSERSPEEDYAPPIQPALPLSLEDYEAQLRAVYPFINDENTFTVVVEKDGRGLGMSVCGGGGLVRIRRLYPPQPAWRTGRLAARDLLLAANGVPLAGLSTYEALEVLRTASPRVEMRVCRPPTDTLESVTPPDPPTPPVRTPHPPPLPPLDPLNCHPMHARLSATTSSATTSSSEGRGRRDDSPDRRRDLRLPDLDRPLPVYDVHYGEFDIVMTKVNGSLGFTLRKEDHSALGHYVRALVREPALSDGRIQPGDRIVAVNDTSMSNMSHGDAVAFLRACGSEVRLRLYRDHAATPLSPMSPKEEGPTDSEGPSNKPKPPLRAEAVSMLCDLVVRCLNPNAVDCSRAEAVSMLCDLAARRLTPDAVDGSRSPCLSPRKFRKLTKENHYEQPNDPSAKVMVESHRPVERETRRLQPQASAPPRAQSVTTNPGHTSPGHASPGHASPGHASPGHTSRKPKLSLTVPPHGYELNNLDNEALDAPNLYQEDISQRFTEPVFHVDSNEPMSMPVDLAGEDARFKHATPAYQSAVLRTTMLSDGTGSNRDGQKDDGKSLKKWKGVTLSPDNERKSIVPPPPIPVPITEIDATAQKENIKPEPPKTETITEPTIVTVELNRGWNSRLGFSVQSHPDSGQSYISAVYHDSVAARDGRLQRGDVILQVNDENVTSMKTPEVIDLLRILRGSICITVLRPPSQ